MRDKLFREDLLLWCSSNLVVFVAGWADTGLTDMSFQFYAAGINGADLVLVSSTEVIDGRSSAARFPLDLQARVIKERQELRLDGTPSTTVYNYSRLDSDDIRFVVSMPTGPNAGEELTILEFLFGQYAIFWDSPKHLGRNAAIYDDDNDDNDDDETSSAPKDRNGVAVAYDEKPNIIARGFEKSGLALRKALRESGQMTGTAVRYLGDHYTAAALASRERQQTTREEHYSRSHPPYSAEVATHLDPDYVDPALVERANRQRNRAETFHAGVRTLTSAALFPVRWTGQKASILAQHDSISQNSNSSRSNNNEAKQHHTIVKKAVSDTIGGLGNGVAHVFKGFTEAMTEIGGAVGDAALTHSTALHGEAYAEQVTKQYLEAAAQVGLAGYKISNVATLGVYGIMLETVVEGTVLAMNLFDFLVGPVLLQGHMKMVQAPFTTPIEYFVVLRPWSIAFYKSSQDFTRPPAKVIPTSMLDTMPRLRQSRDHPPAGVNSGVNTGDYGSNNVDVWDDPMVWNPSGEAAAQAQRQRQGTQASQLLQGQRGAAAAYLGGGAGAAIGGGGGTVEVAEQFIELCTLDCSTYFLHPQQEGAVAEQESESEGGGGVETWFAEIQTACQRVETVKKRKYGAEEIAVLRRLTLLPKKRVILVTVKRFRVEGSRHGGDDDTKPGARVIRRNSNGWAVHDGVDDGNSPAQSLLRDRGGVPRLPVATRIEDDWMFIPAALDHNDHDEASYHDALGYVPVGATTATIAAATTATVASTAIVVETSARRSSHMMINRAAVGDGGGYNYVDDDDGYHTPPSSLTAPPDDDDDDGGEPAPIPAEVSIVIGTAPEGEVGAADIIVQSRDDGEIQIDQRHFGDDEINATAGSRNNSRSGHGHTSTANATTTNTTNPNTTTTTTSIPAAVSKVSAGGARVGGDAVRRTSIRSVAKHAVTNAVGFVTHTATDALTRTKDALKLAAIRAVEVEIMPVSFEGVEVQSEYVKTQAVRLTRSSTIGTTTTATASTNDNDDGDDGDDAKYSQGEEGGGGSGGGLFSTGSDNKNICVGGGGAAAGGGRGRVDGEKAITNGSGTTTSSSAASRLGADWSVNTDEETFQLGYNASVSPEECSHLIFKIRGLLAVGGDIEIGRGTVPLSAIQQQTNNSRGHLGSSGSSNQSTSGSVSGSGRGSVRGSGSSENTVTVEVDITRKRSHRVVGKLIVEVGFLDLDHH